MLAMGPGLEYGGMVALIRTLDPRLHTLPAHTPLSLNINVLGTCTPVYVNRPVSIRTVVFVIPVSCVIAVAFRSIHVVPITKPVSNL